ncbi:hypothetical protein [Pseudolysinimonas sp.]|uniref:hypothetical protein n=1 Tax=Pseudolysinimonas sp. TaxID=2680009 RepID=UPI00286BAF03|nr:hypothetical protein [Pseudolysinimonas sp.]
MPHRANGSYVSNSDALTAWTPIARARLLETAGSYHAVVTDEQLAVAVQQTSGIIHDDPANSWIGKLLDRVDLETQRNDEPPLAALCVDDFDDDAKAERRLLCYRAYSDDLPADGGVPARVARPATRPAARRKERPRAGAASRPRSSSTPAHASDPPRARETTCTSCFLIVPVGPICSSCGAPLGE